MNILDIESFFLRHGSSRASSYLQYTKNLHIEAPIHLARFNRCAYYSIFRTAGLPQCSSKVGASDDATAHEHFLDDITDQLQLVFARLKPNSLRAFRYVRPLLIACFKADSQQMAIGHLYTNGGPGSRWLPQSAPKEPFSSVAGH